MQMKTINFRTTNDYAREHGFQPKRDLALIPLAVNLDSLSPAARWIAEHITSTYVMDEARDRIDIIAESVFSMKERDIAKGVSAEKISRTEKAYGAVYAEEKMTLRPTFPIVGNRFKTPEAVLEETAAQLAANGAARIYSSNNKKDEFIF